MAMGYIYLLLNPSLRARRYKIGMTTHTPEERAAEVSRATAVPEPFEVAYAKKVADCRLAEQKVKERLEERRVSTNREFYDIELQDAIAILDAVADEVGVVDDVEGSRGARESRSGTTVSQSTEKEAASEFTIHVPPKKRRRSSTSPKRGRKTIDEHLSVCAPEIRDLFQKFRKKVKELAPDIQENSWSYGVAYRANQNFAEMYFRSNRLEVCLRPTTYSDPENLLGKVPDKYKWTLNRRFLLEDEGHLDYLVSLVRQSYENVS